MEANALSSELGFSGHNLKFHKIFFRKLENGELGVG